MYKIHQKVRGLQKIHALHYYHICLQPLLCFCQDGKQTHVIRKFKTENMIEANQVKIFSMIQSSLLDQLQYCIVTLAVQNLFAQPSPSFNIFAHP